MDIDEMFMKGVGEVAKKLLWGKIGRVERVAL